MPSLELTLFEDFWRRGRWGFLLAFFGVTALMLLVYGALWNEAGGQLPGDTANVNLHVAFSMAFGFASIMAAFYAQGKLSRFFPHPISAARLVASQMIPAIVVVALLYLAGAVFLNTVVDAGWPLWGPALFFAAAAACVQAAVWLTEGSLVLQTLACIGITIPLTIWFARRYGAFVFGDWNVMWGVPTAGEIAVLATLTAVGYLAAVWGVARQRRGATFEIDALVTAAAEWLTAAGGRAERISSPAAAAAWYEWRQKHAAIPVVIMGAVVLLALAMRTFGFIDSREMLEDGLLALPLTILAFILPLLFGFLLGNCGTSQQPHNMRHLLATSPLTSQALANSLLSTGAIMLVSVWLVWVLGLAAGIGLCFKLDGAAELAGMLDASLTGYWHFPLFACLALPAGWAFLGCLLTLTSAGRPKLIVGFFLGVAVPTMLFMLVAKSLAPEYKARFYEAGVGMTGLLAIGAFAFFGIWTRRNRLVTERTTWLVVAGWLALGGAYVVLCLALGLTYIGWLIHVAGICALAAMPFVSVPLAVHWNRHR
jgi:hypothetical protein